MDPAGRGRSAYVDSVYDPNNPKAPKFVEREFIAYEKHNLFPQTADAPDLAWCWRQKEPARQLVKFNGIPIVLVHADASFAIPKAPCGPAGLGIHGNGHFR